MTTKKPPVPPANRSPKGSAKDPEIKRDNPAAKEPENIDQVGDRANVRQNTTNQDFKHRR